jgi:hypothetical protein
VADLARHVDVGEEVHLDLDDAVALAGLASAAPDIEAEPARLIPPGLGLVGLGVEGADLVKDAGVGGGVGAGSPADGRLVDFDDLADMLNPLDAVMEAGLGPGPGDLLGQGLVQHLIDQGALAGTRDAGDADKFIQGKGHIQVFEVVLPGPPHGEELAVAGAALFGNRNGAGAA